MKLLVSLALLGLAAALPVPRRKNKSPLERVAVTVDAVDSDLGAACEGTKTAYYTDDGVAGVSYEFLPLDSLEGFVSISRQLEGGAQYAMVNKALAERLDTSLNALVPINQATGPVDEHQDTFKDGTPVGIVDIIYVWINEAKGKFHLLDKRTGKDAFAIDIEAGLHIKYQNDLFTHRVDADESSMRFSIGPMSRRYVGGDWEAVGNIYSCIDYCNGVGACDPINIICKRTDGDCDCIPSDSCPDNFEWQTGEEFVPFDDCPTDPPTTAPTTAPTPSPSDGPTTAPTATPTDPPTTAPTTFPTPFPSDGPTLAPSATKTCKDLKAEIKAARALRHAAFGKEAMTDLKQRKQETCNPQVA